MPLEKTQITRFAPHALAGAGVAAVLVAPAAAAALLTTITSAFLRSFDWLVLSAALCAILLCAVIMVSPVGRLKLGGDDAEPEFALLSWWAMLFAAGMGAGLVFWGAAEPLIFASTPPPGGMLAFGTDGAHRQAMAQALFHWAIHPWAIYAISALSIAFFAYRRRAPVLPSAPFEAVKAEGAVRSPWRRLIDWAALLAVVFGVVGSLGNGVLQMAAGAEALTGQPLSRSLAFHLGLLTALAGVYSLSAAGGLKKGILPLSDFNMGLCLLIVAFIFVAGPTGAILTTLVQSFIDYASALPALSVELRAEGAGRQWTRDWTLSSFLWWVAWGPFVGVFVARISKGRTLRTFVASVVLVPSLFTLLWFGTFGGAALALQANGLDLGVHDGAGAPMASYVLLDALPLTPIMQGLTALLVFIFLVTSADSGAYVLAMFSSDGDTAPGQGERVFWGVVLAALTAGALAAAASGEGDSQSVMRTFAVSGAIPLLFLMIAQGGRLAWALWVDKTLTRDR